MSELIIRTENLEALQRIAEFLKTFGFEVIFKERQAQPVTKSTRPETANGTAEDYTDWLSLAGIWKNNPVTAEQLRL